MKGFTQKIIRQRKFFMVLPLLVVPFLTLIFWALGGGQGTAARTTNEMMAGLNLELPNAQFKNDEKAWDKLSLYQQAQRDSIKFNEAKRNDPYFRLPPLKVDQDTSKKKESGAINSSLGKKNHSMDDNEERIHRKLRELQKHIEANPDSEPIQAPKESEFQAQSKNSSQTNDIDRLESMMTMMQSGDQEDTEMKEVNEVLTKILDIQHPERVNARIKEQSQKNPKQVFGVSIGVDESVGLLQNEPSDDDSSYAEIEGTNQFFGIDVHQSVADVPKSFTAEIYDTQTLIAGSIIKLKLTGDIYVNGILIPRNQFVYGICALNGERLTIKINSVRSGNTILPVSMDVYDLDGLEGIYVPGALTRTVAKESSNQTISELQLNAMNPTLEVQAASAGIETAKSLLSKKTKMIKVTVKSGYKILLRDSSKSDNN